MRLSFSTLFLSTLSLISLVSAAKPHFVSRHDHKRSPVPNVLVARQHRVTRDLIDVCINVKVDLLADASQLLGLGPLLGPIDLGAKIQLCLCLDDLDLYLETNDEIQGIVNLLGKDAVAFLIRLLINPNAQGHHCHFPPHSHHVCHNHEPCQYECDEHYIRDGDTCVCAPGYVSCNGVCDISPHGCSSAVPHPVHAKRDAIVTLDQAKAVCKSHESVCGIAGRENSRAFECIDVTSTKNSCGGCMAAHSFFEAEPLRQSSGQDCSSIPNVKSVRCSQNLCVVSSCKEGWIPSDERSACVLDTAVSIKMRRVLKRSDPLALDVVADALINSDLLTQLATMLGLVIDLNDMVPDLESPSSPASITTPAGLPIASLLNGVNLGAGNVITSKTVNDLIASIDALLGQCSLLDSALDSCGCVGQLGSGFLQKLASLTVTLLDIQKWCTSHPIVPVPGGPSTPEQAIVIGLSDILATLGLNGKSGIFISGLLGGGATRGVNGLLNGLSIGPNNYRRHTPASQVNPQLLTKITAVVHLAVKLGGYTPLLPAVGSNPDALVNANLLVPVIQATANIVNAYSTSSLVNAINHLVEVSSTTQHLLGHCGCVDSLGLQQLVAHLNLVIAAALDAQHWCHSHPPGSIPTPPTAPSHPNSDVPIVVGLSDLLTGLGLLGPIKSSVVVDSPVGSGVAGGLDQTLNGLGIGFLNAKRAVSTTVDALLDASLLSQVKILVTLGLNLGGAVHTIPSSTTSACPGGLNTLVAEIVAYIEAISKTSTTSSLLAYTEKLIGADAALQNLLGKCTHRDGLDDLVAYLVLITEAALGLETSCGPQPTAAPHSIIATVPHSTGSSVPHSTGASVPHSTHPATSVSHAPTPISSVHHTSAHSTAITGPHTPASHPGASISISVGVSVGTPVPTAPHTPSHPAPTVVHPNPPTSGSNNDLIVSLNHLLSSLGLSGVKGVVSVGGLDPGLTSTGNHLLNGLSIGPNDLRRRGPGRRRSDS